VKRWLTYILKWVVLVVLGLPVFIMFGGSMILVALPMHAIEWAIGAEDGVGWPVLSDVCGAVRFPKAPWKDDADA